MAHANIKGHFKNTKGQQSSLKRSQKTLKMDLVWQRHFITKHSTQSAQPFK